MRYLMPAVPPPDGYLATRLMLCVVAYLNHRRESMGVSRI